MQRRARPVWATSAHPTAASASGDKHGRRETGNNARLSCEQASAASQILVTKLVIIVAVERHGIVVTSPRCTCDRDVGGRGLAAALWPSVRPCVRRRLICSCVRRLFAPILSLALRSLRCLRRVALATRKTRCRRGTTERATRRTFKRALETARHARRSMQTLHASFI